MILSRMAVHVSKSPGCTRSVNYYGLVKPKTIGARDQSYITYFVDLPWYGYAKASKTDQTKWKETMTGFLTSRDFTVLRYVVCCRVVCIGQIMC